MGYDLHVVRTKDWTEAKKKPILREDVDRLIQLDRELAWSLVDSYNGKHDVIEWRGYSCFLWNRYEITSKNPSQKQIIKLAQIATKLNAYCVGDDDEQYVFQRTWLGGESVKIIPAK